jgi:hypothetical protein
MARLFAFLAVLLLIGACANAPDFGNEPYIEFREIRNHMIAQSDQADTIVFTLYFEDGDGDLRPPGDGSANVFLRDLRDSTVAFTFASPVIPTEGSGNGIRGTLELRAGFLRGDICCLYESGQPPCTPAIPIRSDTIYYDIYLFDAAGNKSNTVKAGPVVLKCD